MPRELCVVADWCRRNVAWVLLNKIGIAFVFGKGDSNQTRSAQNVHKMATLRVVQREI